MLAAALVKKQGEEIMPFSKDFLWGAASAAVQVEGAWNEDGKCPSIWDVAGKRIKNGQDCHTACDHYHRYKEDVALMKELGLKSYRFSISWPRVMPAKGQVNPKGIAFYKNLIVELKAAGIEPLVTLYHWDLPQWVQEEGGWKSKKVIGYFKEYVKVVVEALSDDVTYWMTINEPQMFCFMGNILGTTAPFKRGFLSMMKIMRIALLAHGEAVKVIRETAKRPVKVGFASASAAYVPEDERPESIEKARSNSFDSKQGMFSNGFWCDPILLGRAPKMMARSLSKADMEIIHQPLDFIGINIYQPMNKDFKGGIDSEMQNSPRTMMGWIVDGRCLYWAVRFFEERYHVPIMVTENGMANPDEVTSDGKVHDAARIHFIDDYLKNLKRAVDEGAHVIGYQHWSIMDNFEWCEGYGPRFGLIHIDYDSQKRTIKDSAYHYAEIIRSNGENILP